MALFERRNFNNIQKKAKCKVLINYNETGKMTLGEVLEFMEELDEGRHSQYDVPVIFTYEKLEQKVQETVISNEDKFCFFLILLYSAYRKMEMQMEKAGCPGILADLEYQERSLDQISFNLNKAKDEYRSMERNDFLKIYPVLKKLFSCYTDYIRYSASHTNKIDEGDHLPKSWVEIMPWLDRLNSWSPKAVSIENINWMNSLVAMPSGHERVIQTLLKTTKFTDCYVVIDNQGTEPFIRDEKKRILFGFVNMEGAKPGQNSNSSILEVECPRDCTMNIKRWICTKCGDYVFIKENQIKHQFLFCSCGSKKYRDELLICHHPIHRPQESNRSQNQNFSYDDLIPSLYRQLEQVRIRTEGITDRRILIAITHLSNRRNEEEMRGALRKLQGLNLDANIRRMIDLYVNRNG